MNKLLLIGAALVLSACGSSRDDHPPPITQNPGQVVDPFYTRVNGVVGAQPEDTEPTDVSTVAGTEPEGTEPTSG